MTKKREIEAFGVTYDRYIFLKVLKKFVKKYRIRTAVEIPAGGEKAMPSIYSIGLALAGCHVTLINPDKNATKVWRELNLIDKVKFVNEKDIYNIHFEDNSFDFAWNCITFPKIKNKRKLLDELKRVSKDLVFVIACNNFQTGYLIHILIHKVFGFPWTHGETKYNYIWNIKKEFNKAKLKVIDSGFIDSPPWPDPAGPRDIRLHRDFNVKKLEPEWHAPIVDYIKSNKFPTWMKLLSIYDVALMSGYTKMCFSHLFYVLGRK